MVVYGRDPLQFVKYNHDPQDVVVVHEQLLQWNAVLLKLKYNLNRAQQIIEKKCRWEQSLC